MSKLSYGVVFSGGGALGAWEAGAFQAIWRHHDGTAPLLATGTSSGALNAAAVASGLSPGELSTEWIDLRRHDVLKRGTALGFAGISWMLLSGIVRAIFGGRFWASIDGYKSLYSNAPLERTLSRLLAERWKTFEDAKIRCLVASTSLASRTRIYYFNGPAPAHTVPQVQMERPPVFRKLDSFAALRKALLASTAVPIAFEPVYWSGTQDPECDGGILRNQPLLPALALLEAPPDVLYVLIPQPDQVFELDIGLGSLASHIIGMLIEQSLVQQIDAYILRKKIGGVIKKTAMPALCVIRPSSSLTKDWGVDLLDFGKNVRELVTQGDKDARACIAYFDPNDTTTWLGPGHGLKVRQ